MLQVVNISKSYGSEVVLEDVSFVVNPGERAGLIGPNGCGKSTLLRIIAGVEQADNGRVALSSRSSVAWIPQGSRWTLPRLLARRYAGVSSNIPTHTNGFSRSKGRWQRRLVLSWTR